MGSERYRIPMDIQTHTFLHIGIDTVVHAKVFPVTSKKAALLPATC